MTSINVALVNKLVVLWFNKQVQNLTYFLWITQVSIQLQRPFSTWKGLNMLQNRLSPSLKSHPYPSLVASQASPLDRHSPLNRQHCAPSSVSFSHVSHQSWKVRAVKQTHLRAKPVTNTRMRTRSKLKSERYDWQSTDSGSNLNILSLCIPV